MTAVTATAHLYAESLVSVATDIEPTPLNELSLNFSGIVINQNGPSISPSPGYVNINAGYYVQEFYLPSDYGRGTGTVIYPELSGLEICVGVQEGFALTASLDYYVQTYVFGIGWIPLTRGTQIGAHTDGDQLWMSIYFDPVDVSEFATNKFRFGIAGRTSFDSDAFHPVDDFDATTVTIQGVRIPVIPDLSPVPLEEGHDYPFNLNGRQYFLYVEHGTGIIYYSAQQGVTRLWYTTPNPLLLQRVKGYGSDGVTAILDTAREVSFMFRLLANSADDGIDYLGNNYRSCLTRQKVRYIATGTATADNYWLSKPNPSKFAVESLYFDVRHNGDPAVIDRVLIDPVTPGIYAQIYYSNDQNPGQDTDSWDKLMWTHVPRAFALAKRDTYVLPTPITANFVKIEFSHLQARHYAPGDFQRPIKYRKHPSWVLDYFLALYQAQSVSDDPYVASTVNVAYDAIDLAFSYYTNDIAQTTNMPNVIPDKVTEIAQIANVTSNTDSAEGKVDTETLAKINTAFQRFSRLPALMGSISSILGQYGMAISTNTANEDISYAVADTTNVSTTDREGLILENNFPVMYFYIECRHGYRESLAMFDNDTGYFAGIKQVAFLREQYSTQSDDTLYIESAGDNINVERNDFVFTNGTWTTH